MGMKQTTAKDIDEYIARCPADVQAILQQIRQTIRDAAPGAQEKISYRMPAFHLQGKLVYFAAWKQHIGFYPPVAGDEELQQEATVYAGEKGNLQFPLDQPIPYDLIRRIVQGRGPKIWQKPPQKRKIPQSSGNQRVSWTKSMTRVILRADYRDKVRNV
jgi:uncharacterized protein YdhG (YjbR/CyaY superfamily)